MKTVITNTQFIPSALAVRKELDLRSGDTVRVHVKIQEKGKTRTQMFEGLVIARKHGSEAGATFTVRKMSHGVGVEKIFPLYTPMIDKIEIIRRAKVRRAKLYFLRDKVTKAIRRKMRNFKDFFATSNDLTVPEDSEEMAEEIIEETITESEPIVETEVEAEVTPSETPEESTKEETAQ
jgi:large subunit ribosomal protein L19